MKKCLFFLLFLSFSAHFFSQAVPPNTRLIQLNTKKGSVLTSVELSQNFAYHIGTSNSSEIGVDNLTAMSVGLDDLFIIKSNVTSGANVWLKTFNAGSNGIITPRYSYVDSLENIYVYGQFTGTITINSASITSSIDSSSFLMKINSSGVAEWVNLLDGGNNTLYPKIKCTTDGIDTFLIYNQNHLVRFNDVTGETIYDRIYSGAELKSVALKNSNLYVAGASQNPFSAGTEYVDTPFTGFILKGDKDAIFTASAIAKIAPDNTNPKGTDINDIAVDIEGNLIATGFSVGSSKIISENGTFEYTYSPNSTFESNRIYHFVAKLDADLFNVSFFRTSSPITSDASLGVQTRKIAAIIKPYGSGNFRMIIKNSYFTANNSITSFTNSNGTSTVITPIPGDAEYNQLLSFDSSGFYLFGNQSFINRFMNVSHNFYVTASTNNRLFSSSIINATNNGQVWGKSKMNAVGGRILKPFHKHLNSAKNDMFVSTLVEGNVNFFGRQSNTSTNMIARYITRLGGNGLPKWIAQFSMDTGKDELNVSGDFACVDKDDNLIFLANPLGTSPQFIDALSNVKIFSTNNFGDKIIIKLNKDGGFVWSKQIEPSALAEIKGALATDSEGNIVFTGITNKNLTIDGNLITSSGSSTIFIIKFSAAGNVIFTKSYPNVGAYSLLPVFDAKNNLYVFTEPSNIQNSNYIFDGVSIPTNPEYLDHLMLKFDNTGKVIFGKNFHSTLPVGSTGYSWPNDVVFDGSDFILMGNYYVWSNVQNFYGLDSVLIPRVYTGSTAYTPFMAKISLGGNVVWQKAIHTITSSTGNYTNIETDVNKNIYTYFYMRGKMNFNDIEYNFNSDKGDKVFFKFDTNGSLKYNKIVDTNLNVSPRIDVIGEDKFNVSGFTNENNILNYPIPYNRASSLYIATFGNLDQKYLTPIKDYLTITEIAMLNNPDNANTFSFDLVNNTDWNAASDQPWLNLSFLSLVEKNNYKNSISGNGDAKIIISADTNNSGANRSGSILLNGTGVDSKTIIVIQTLVLSTGEAKTVVTTLYPNPTSDILNIETKQTISKIEIFDLSGKLLKSENGKEKKVSVSELTKGIYLIKLYTENGVINSKFIKK